MKNNSPKKFPICPICKKPSVQKFRPFCSERCQLIDLGHWLKGSYVIPGNDIASDAEKQKEDDEEESN